MQLILIPIMYLIAQFALSTLLEADDRVPGKTAGRVIHASTFQENELLAGNRV